MRAAVAREDDAEEGAEKKGGSGVVQSSGAAHTAACVALQRSPALPEFILTVGDWTFCIFKTGVKVARPRRPLPCSLCPHARADTPVRVAVQPEPPHRRPLVPPPQNHNQNQCSFVSCRSPNRPSVILIAKADGSME